MFMCGLDFLFSSSTEIVIVADRNDNDIINGLTLVRSIYNPNKVVILKTDTEVQNFKELFPFTNDMKMKDNYTTFFVCRDYACNQPVNSITELEKLLTI